MTNTAATRPYDFSAAKDGTTMKVEVKGSTSNDRNAIAMTKNEVELHRAERRRTALFIVSGIRLLDRQGQRRAEGGLLEALVGWDIDDWEIVPTAYRLTRK